MKSSGILWFSSVIFALNFCGPAGLAQSRSESPPSPAKFSLDDNFRGGQFEASLTAGTLFSPIGTPRNRPVLDYALNGLQLGCMLTQPGDSGFFRGNLELAVEGFGACIYKGPGNYIAGSTLWFRYNFVPLHGRVTPYVQLGGGFVFTDIDHHYVGQNFNFNLDAALGLRCFVSQHWTLNLEYRLQHISNADLGARNIGINAQGPVASISWFF